MQNHVQQYTKCCETNNRWQFLWTTYGCFEPGALAYEDGVSGCTAIDFDTSKSKAGAVKKDLYTCDRLPDIEQYLLQELIGIATELGNRIGVYVRVDLFGAANRVYVQQYTTNHMNGLRHCAAKIDDKGCIDSCFIGRMWSDAGGVYGGCPTAVPNGLNGFRLLSPSEQCSLLTGVPKPPKHVSKCPLPGPP